MALYGGLGNQMFQYAFYKYLKLNGFNVFLDKISMESLNQHQKHETFRLDYFQLNDTRYATVNDILEFIPKTDPVFSHPFSDIIKTESFLLILKAFFYRINKKLTHKHMRSKIWSEWSKKGSESKKHFYKNRLTKNTRKYMKGRYQEYCYPDSIREHLISDFTFEETIPESVSRYYSEIIENNSVSIHVRRGDYSGTKEYDICSMNYYIKSINYILESQKNSVFYIFSDDLQWVTSNFIFPKKYVIVDNSQFEKSDYFDLYLMKNCKHNIIQNSTFSWWGAWLNQNTGKIVICPEKWNGLDHVFTDEICPPDWKRMKIC